MLKRVAVWIALLAPAVAFAQQPLMIDADALGREIGQLVIQKNAVQAQVNQLRAQLAHAQERIKALEDKYEPKSGASPENK
jgi:hypothetical protein